MLATTAAECRKYLGTEYITDEETERKLSIL